MEKIFTHRVSIQDVKPIINKSGIYFPLNVKNGYVEEDGLSFGCPVDSGFYAIVKYEAAVGALAEDTHALFMRIYEMEKTSAKPLDLTSYVQFRVIKKWDKKHPANMNCQDCGGKCDNYHHWNFERQKAYDEAHYVSEKQIAECEKIIDLGNEQVFKNAKGEYFARFKHWFYGNYIPAKLTEDMTEDELLNIVQVKLQIQSQVAEMKRKGKENLKMLAKIFGHTAK